MSPDYEIIHYETKELEFDDFIKKTNKRLDQIEKELMETWFQRTSEKIKEEVKKKW